MNSKTEKVKNSSAEMTTPVQVFGEAHISIECVDNADGFPGVIVDDDATFISFQENATEQTASDDGQGPYSSVRPFQFARYEYEDAAKDRDHPETVGNPLPSPEEEEEEEEEEEDDDCSRLQPSDINIPDMALIILCIVLLFIALYILAVILYPTF